MSDITKNSTVLVTGADGFIGSHLTEARVRPEKSEVKRLWADNAKAKAILEWQPAYGGHNGFERGLSETVEWFTTAKNLHGYKSEIYNV